MAEYDGILQFRSVGIRRLRDAEELLQPPTIDPYSSDANTRHLRTAVYLAGYSIECVLKEYIISRTPPAMTLDEALRIRAEKGLSVISVNSAEGHNLSALLKLTDLEASIFSEKKVTTNWHICLGWRSTWRYDPDPPTRQNAEAFVEATRNVYQWIKNRV